MNIALWLERTATAAPDAPALLLGDRQVADYAAFHRRATGLAGWLRAEGIAPGDRVAVLMRNCPEYLVVLHAIWIAGAAAVPINAKLHPAEAGWIVEDSGARLVVVTPGLSADASVPTLDAAAPDFAAACDGPSLGCAARDAAELAWLFYTSGTTGRPKGVRITHGMLAAMSLSYLADVDEVRAGDAALYAAPMSHGAGLYALVHVLRGAAHICPPSGGYDPAEFLDIAAAHGSVSAFLAPTMIHRLTRAAAGTGRDGAGVRTVVYGGGPMHRATLEAALDRFGPRFVQIYGQGECPMCITALSRADIADRAHPDWARRVGSVGRAQSLVEVAILGQDDLPVPMGEVGEIAVRGAPVMPGYWNAPEASADTLRNGWLHTGDRGTLDADGFVTLIDRSKDVIISGGTNIYPREVEEALLAHPDVDEAVVIGRPSLEWGEDVVAYVVARAGVVPDAARLDAHCVARIARFKRPKHYRFVADLPKNAYGKVAKITLRAREAEAVEVASDTDDPIR